MNDLVIRIVGSVTESNLEEYKEKALAEIKAANKDLITEEDYVTAESVIKKCAATEKAIVKTKEDALNQTADIRKLFTALDELSAELRTTRLALEKKVVNEKEKRKNEIINAGINSVTDHINDMVLDNKDLFGLLHVNAPLIKDSAKGKKTLIGMKDAVDASVSAMIGSVNETVARCLENLSSIASEESSYPGLFPDKRSLCLLPLPEVRATIEARVANFKLQAEEKRQRDEKSAEETRLRQKLIAEEARKKEENSEKEVLAPDVADIDKTEPFIKQAADPVVKQDEKQMYIVNISIMGEREQAIAVAREVAEFLQDNKLIQNISLKK